MLATPLPGAIKRMQMVRAEKQGAQRRENGVTLSALATFVLAVDCGSFSRAAEALGVSQPSVSNQINALETALGLRLLNRRSTPQTLTDAGRDIYTRARLVLTRMADLESSAKDFGALRKGSLRVGFSSPRIALRSIARFMDQYPQVSVATRTGNTESLRKDVLDCTIDVGIFSLAEPDPLLSCTCLGKHRLQLLSLAQDNCGSLGPVSMADASKMPLIGREPGSTTRALTEAVFQTNGYRFAPHLTVTGAQAVFEAVLANVGKAIIFAGQSDGDVRFQTQSISGADVNAGLYLVTLSENLEIPAVASFRQTAMALAEGDLSIQKACDG